MVSTHDRDFSFRNTDCDDSCLKEAELLLYPHVGGLRRLRLAWRNGVFLVPILFSTIGCLYTRMSIMRRQL